MIRLYCVVIFEPVQFTSLSLNLYYDMSAFEVISFGILLTGIALFSRRLSAKRAEMEDLAARAMAAKVKVHRQAWDQLRSDPRRPMNVDPTIYTNYDAYLNHLSANKVAAGFARHVSNGSGSGASRVADEWHAKKSKGATPYYMPWQPSMFSSCVCTYACMYVCMYVCMHVRALYVICSKWVYHA
jgi:hypothetical protein